MTGESTRGAAPFGWRVERLDSIDSTNEEARRRALAGDPGRLWVVAGEQTAGRGRRGRDWVSPRGNLHASALLIDPGPQALSPQLGFVAGVALARAALDVDAGAARLKWPNDLVVDGAKCAGLLLEGAALPDRRFACAAGIAALFERLAARFDEALGLWARGEGFVAIRDLWLERAAGLGTTVRISDGHGRREGAFEGLDADGRLLFRGADGLETIEAADLWISPASDDAPARGVSGSPVWEGPA